MSAVAATSSEASRPERAGQSRVVVLGSLNVDLVTHVAHHPSPGETVRGDGFDRRPGGKGANQAVAAAAAGAVTWLIGCVGDDPVAADYLALLARAGVDVSAVRTCAGEASGHALIVVDGCGENSIVVIPGANAMVGAPELAALTATVRAADVVVVQCEVPAEAVRAAAVVAGRAGARCVLNLAPYQRFERADLEHVDVIVVNETEHRDLLADHPDLDPSRLVVTAGAGGARWGGTARPAVAVAAADVVDTTGAGDAFCGALAAALAAGLDQVSALDRGLAAGAAAVRFPGAQRVGF